MTSILAEIDESEIVSFQPKFKTKHTLPQERNFDVQAFVDHVGVGSHLREFKARGHVYVQGDHATNVFYLQRGCIKLSVLNRAGSEAVVGILKPGDFFGEGCLADQSIRVGTATAITASTVLFIEKREMLNLLHGESVFSDRFIAFMLTKNIRIEGDLIDQLFNSIEKRLARSLLLLAGYQEGQRKQILPKVSQEMLAEMIGTTRTRVNLFMNKFRKLGFIEYKNGLQVNKSLLSVVLHD